MAERAKLSRRWRAAVMAACVTATCAVVPRAVVGRDADAFFDGALSAQEPLARAVADEVSRGVDVEDFHTGSERFDGEWALASSQMAALGLSQVIAAHPELRPRYLPALRAAVERLLRPRTFAFATRAWGASPFDTLDDDAGHAYLGYVALGVGALRAIEPTTPRAALHDRLVAVIERRLSAARDGVVETYPGEAYPCDIASMVGALGQHARITGADHRAVIARMAAVYRTRWTDRYSGYLAQAIVPATGRWLSPPRASGTALSAYFWSFADDAMARDLNAALARNGHRSLAGFGAVSEYARGDHGPGDIDSGPVVLGVSVSATGFALASARRWGDRARFRELYRTAALFGVPVARGRGRAFVAGGPIGNAMLLAMLTAGPR